MLSLPVNTLDFVLFIFCCVVPFKDKPDKIIRRVFRAKDLPALWTAIKYMNIERQESGRPVMKQIRIKTMRKYDGEFSDIIGNFDADMELDVEEKMA